MFESMNMIVDIAFVAGAAICIISAVVKMKKKKNQDNDNA